MQNPTIKFPYLSFSLFLPLWVQHKWAQSCKITLLPFLSPDKPLTSHWFFLSTTSNMVINLPMVHFVESTRCKREGERELEFVILPIKRQNWIDCLKVDIPYFLLFWNSSIFCIKLTNIFWCRVYNFKRLSSAWWI
jgi:hypothetical protein